MNLALLHGLGLKGLADSKAAGADVMERAFGLRGAQLVSLFVAIAALTSINATMIVGARTNYAMGRDWSALRFMGGWHAERGTPRMALLVQGADRAGAGRFRRAAARRLRGDGRVHRAGVLDVPVPRRHRAVPVAREGPGAERPFRVPLFPITPIVFCAACAWLAYSSITYAASRNAVHISLIVMAVGVIALLLTRAKRTPTTPAVADD